MKTEIDWKLERKCSRVLVNVGSYHHWSQQTPDWDLLMNNRWLMSKVMEWEKGGGYVRGYLIEMVTFPHPLQQLIPEPPPKCRECPIEVLVIKVQWREPTLKQCILFEEFIKTIILNNHFHFRFRGKEWSAGTNSGCTGLRWRRWNPTRREGGELGRRKEIFNEIKVIWCKNAVFGNAPKLTWVTVVCLYNHVWGENTYTHRPM